MKEKRFSFLEKYHFELKHLIVLLFILVLFLLSVSFVHKTSIQNLLIKTQDWYQQDSAERMANLSATSLELLLETTKKSEQPGDREKQEIIQAFNIILNQPLLQHTVNEICILVFDKKNVIPIAEGKYLYEYFFSDSSSSIPILENDRVIKLFNGVKSEIISDESIHTIREGKQTFHVFVPFVPKGEMVGVLYIKNSPDFTFITREIISSFDETAIIFAALILLGLLAMFYISSYTVKERDDAQEKLLLEHERNIMEKINHQKEALFAKRIYHTHHKAEKIMGFIKEDLRMLTDNNIESVKYRVNKYANFVSRVIYDMKWYDPPIQTIRNPLFNTNLNEVIRFLVDNLFLRLSDRNASFYFKLELDEDLPGVNISEFVVWEIIEPLLQNCIDHAGKSRILITIKTIYAPESGVSEIIISDNGEGIEAELLEPNENGIKKIFLENITTKEDGKNSGYGCYLAYEIAKERCAWKLDAENLGEGGCRYTITF
jgi:anti-sigma regulatory factor (Ser/Thr protein kinase)